LRKLLEVLDREVVLLRGVEDARQGELGALRELLDVLAFVLLRELGLSGDGEDLLQGRGGFLAVRDEHPADRLEVLGAREELRVARDLAEKRYRLVELPVLVVVPANDAL